MPRAEIDALREERLLGDLLPWAYQRSPLIRETWDAAGITADDVQSMDDFHEKVPFIDKDAIRDFRDRHHDPYGGLLCLDPKMTEVFSAIFSTSGTTGDPTPAPYAGRGPSMLVREFWELGAVGPATASCTACSRSGARGSTTPSAASARRPSSATTSPATSPQLVRLSRELRPTGWYTISGPLVMMLEAYARETGVDLREAFSSYRGVIFAGEPIGPRARRLRRGGLGPRAVPPDRCRRRRARRPSAGSTTATTSGRTPATSRTSSRWARTPVGDGERGELVSTTLLDKIAPLIRYRSDDLVRITRATCACGRTHGRVWPLGRKGDEMRRRRPVGDARRRVGRDRGRARDERGAVPDRAHTAADGPAPHPGRATRPMGPRVSTTCARAVHDAVQGAVGVEPDIELVANEVLLRQGPPHKIPRVAKQ